jgi:hypothetical protein
MLVLDAHQRFENRLHAIARRLFPPGVYHLDLSDVAALGGGDMAAGEQILHRMFKMAGPRAVHPDALRELGDGSIATGRKVLQKLIDRSHEEHGAKDANELEPEAEHHARGGGIKITKAGASYHDCADSGRICAVCDMFKEPNGCTLVRGDISRTASCNHFAKAKS